MLIGETISLCVALSWTATALFAEVGSKRMGSLPFNAIRMTMSLIMFLVVIWLLMGVPYPRYADTGTWVWLILSGIVGYVIGDYCLMQGYIFIGSRFGQLFMTLSAPTAAIFGYLLIGEVLKPLAIIGMVVTLSGISMSILSRGDNSPKQHHSHVKPADDDTPKHHNINLSLPKRGIFYAAMAGICQGAGLVLSKIGMTHYHLALECQGISDQITPDGALIPIPLCFSVPFAATMIRAIIGMAGFIVLLLFFTHDGKAKLQSALKDRKAMRCVLGSMLFGPFIGVSLSLLATQYTSTGIAQTLFALTPVLIIAPAAWLFHQKVTIRETIGAVVSVAGACLFFI